MSQEYDCSLCEPYHRPAETLDYLRHLGARCTYVHSNSQTSGRGFVKAFQKRVLGSDLVDLLTGPHGVDRYTELVAPTWTLGEARAKVVDVRRHHAAQRHPHPRSERAFASAHTVKAGQYVNLTVDIDGRRHTRCYSPANAEGSSYLELTIGHHDGGLVSTYLYEHARRGMVVGLDRRRR